MNKEEYKEYLQSEHWKGFRERYKASKKPQVCSVCGDPHVDLHHLTYERINRERLTDVIPLCREHHEDIHRHREQRKKKRSKAAKRRHKLNRQAAKWRKKEEKRKRRMKPPPLSDDEFEAFKARLLKHEFKTRKL